MAEKKLDKYRVAILATDLFEESELIETRKALQEAAPRSPSSLRSPERFRPYSTTRRPKRSKST